MGEKYNQPFQFWFNASLKIDFQGSRVAPDGGLRTTAPPCEGDDSPGAKVRLAGPKDRSLA
jgi:hypothetical protein